MDVKYSWSVMTEAFRFLHLIAYCLLGFTLVISCSPEPLKLEQVNSIQPEIVVSSQILPNNLVVILLTKTVSHLDVSGQPDTKIPIDKIAVDDAVVKIKANGKMYLLKRVDRGRYETNEIPLKEGLMCELVVNSNTLGEISSTAVVQAPVKFDSVAAKIYFNGYNNYWAEVKYAFSDPPEKNFYMLNVHSATKGDLVTDMVGPVTYTRLLEDEAFNGNEFSEMFHAVNKNFYDGDTVTISLTNVSPEYYRYVQLRMENNLEVVELFSEPIHYPTNVVGGRGFFNLHFPDRRLMVLY
jgi:hypothetical protein